LGEEMYGVAIVSIKRVRRWRVQSQEVDQRKLGERLRRKTVRHMD